MSKIGLAISTYFSKDTSPQRLTVFKNCINSLGSKSFPGELVVVDDCSETTEHLTFLESINVPYYRRPFNGGIARTKNTGIRLLIEKGCDIGFLADDDLMYCNANWHADYVKAINATGIPHFCLFLEEGYSNVNYNGYAILRTPHVNGCLLTFTKKLIEEVGYFKVLPYKYGHEHSNFSIRCFRMSKIPYYCDILTGKRNVILQQESITYKALPAIDKVLLKKNEDIAMSDIQKEPLIE